jgi:hypothetical protein
MIKTIKKSNLGIIIAILALLPLWQSLCYADDYYGSLYDYSTIMSEGYYGFNSVNDAYSGYATTSNALGYSNAYLWDNSSPTATSYANSLTGNATSTQATKASTTNGAGTSDTSNSKSSAGTNLLALRSQQTVTTGNKWLPGNISNALQNTSIVKSGSSSNNVTTILINNMNLSTKNVSLNGTNSNFELNTVFDGLNQKTYDRSKEEYCQPSFNKDSVSQNGFKPHKSSNSRSDITNHKELSSVSQANTGRNINIETSKYELKRMNSQNTGHKAINDTVDTVPGFSKTRVEIIKNTINSTGEQLKNAIGGLIPVMRNAYIDSSEIILASDDMNILLPPISGQQKPNDPIESQATVGKSRDNIYGKAKDSAIVPIKTSIFDHANLSSLLNMPFFSIDKSTNYNKTGLSPPDDSLTLTSASSQSAIILPVLSNFQSYNSKISVSNNHIIHSTPSWSNPSEAMLNLYPNTSHGGNA